MIKTRFAPSPTGYLHIGGARTALFAHAWARRHQGQFLLRIEDTDVSRSNPAHSEAIIAAMNWLGLQPDHPPYFQSRHRQRHQQVVQQLLDNNQAYRCYCTTEELATMRNDQIARGESPRYDRRWRDSRQSPPLGQPPVIRFKMPLTGQTLFHDIVKGSLQVTNDELDDFVILRSDSLPTYNLAAVVDDIDMDITHIIRGDDHVMNTFRQWHLFQQLTATLPAFAHLPMILALDRDAHGNVNADAGGKPRYTRLSKRQAAVDISQYRHDGFLPAALCNYLARLSWSHGDKEVFDSDFFTQHFNFEAVQQSPARFDMGKLRWLNREHLRQLPPDALRQLANLGPASTDEVIRLITPRATTLQDLQVEAAYFEHPPSPLPALLSDYLDAPTTLAFDALCQQLQQLSTWAVADIKQVIKTTANSHQLPFKQLGMPMRLILTGQADSPDIAAVAVALGQEETNRRLQKRLQPENPSQLSGILKN